MARLIREFEYMLELYYDTLGFEDYSYGIGESNSEEALQMGRPRTDTSAADVRNGKDIQGIPWEKFSITRNVYRNTRVQQYRNYESLPRSHDELEKDCNHVEKRTYYDFQCNTGLVKSTFVHFQLRNLVWATSKHDVYVTNNFSVIHWSPLLEKSKEVLNVSGQMPSSKIDQGCLAQPFSRVQISTMAVRENLLVAGGFQGELICKTLNKSGALLCTKLTDHENSITNSVELFTNSNGSTQLMAANNDCQVRIIDAHKFALLNQFSFPWSVNNASVNPNGKLVSILGDSTECLLADTSSGKVIATLKGHLDYSFASAWHPDGQILATGNQDTTCRLWDIRNLSESFAVLSGRMGAIRGIKFSSDGRFLAIAEPADFVHIYDVESDYSKAQEIDFFGEVSGISFSPDAESIFIGVADRHFGGLLEFNRRHQHQYLNCFI